jgi:hypothetical protein
MAQALKSSGFPSSESEYFRILLRRQVPERATRDRSDLQSAWHSESLWNSWFWSLCELCQK